MKKLFLCCFLSSIVVACEGTSKQDPCGKGDVDCGPMMSDFHVLDESTSLEIVPDRLCRECSEGICVGAQYSDGDHDTFCVIPVQPSDFPGSLPEDSCSSEADCAADEQCMLSMESHATMCVPLPEDACATSADCGEGVQCMLLEKTNNMACVILPAGIIPVTTPPRGVILIDCPGECVFTGYRPDSNDPTSVDVLHARDGSLVDNMIVSGYLELDVQPGDELYVKEIRNLIQGQSLSLSISEMLLLQQWTTGEPLESGKEMSFTEVPEPNWLAFRIIANSPVQ